jgi:integrase
MAKSSGPRIRKQTSRVKGHDYIRWVVDYGLVDGKRVRETFKTEARANRAIEKWERGLDREAEKQELLATRIGEKAEKLTTDNLLDASKALDVLKSGVSLEAAAKFYMEHNTPRGEQKTVGQLYDGYLLSRQLASRRPDTLRDIRSYLKGFADSFQDKLVQHLTTTDLEQWMQEQNGTPRTRNKRRIHLVGLFNYAVDRSYCVANPASALIRANVPKSRPYIIPPEDVGKLMAYTHEHEPTMVPYLALCLFAGLRPLGEMGRLDWKDINLKRKEIFISDEVSKTGDERYVDIHDNLLGWLKPHWQNSGPIFFSKRKFNRIREKAEIRWEANCMRHSFGSYHLAMFDNAGKTALQMGHRDIGTLFEYYRRAVRKGDAEKYWSILPVS